MENIKHWDGRYKAGTHRSVWPWSDLVSLCERYVFSDLQKGPDLDILEIGCGYGANIPYLLTTGGKYHGIDGSETALSELLNHFQLSSTQLVCGNFTESLIFQKTFDLIVDRGSITCNTDESIKNCVNMIRSSLRAGGYFCGVTWFSKDHSDYRFGESLHGDVHTRHGYTDGPFADTGTVHFTDEDNLKSMLAGFDIVWMEHRFSHEIIPDNSRVNAFYNFVARKT